MSRHRGRYGRTLPLDANPAEFAAYEDRVNAAALHRHLRDLEDAERDAEMREEQ